MNMRVVIRFKIVLQFLTISVKAAMSKPSPGMSSTSYVSAEVHEMLAGL
jgi:hypothetical protein